MLQWSILHAVAAARVLEAWYCEVAPIYSDPKATHPIKHGLAVLVKATVPMLSGVPSEYSLG